MKVPSVLLVNVQLLENKLDDLRLRLSYQRDIKTLLSYFTETWLNDDTDHTELAGFSVHWQDTAATSDKTRGGVYVYLSITAGAR